jgi:hypothetical protein
VAGAFGGQSSGTGTGLGNENSAVAVHDERLPSARGGVSVGICRGNGGGLDVGIFGTVVVVVVGGGGGGKVESVAEVEVAAGDSSTSDIPRDSVSAKNLSRRVCVATIAVAKKLCGLARSVGRRTRRKNFSAPECVAENEGWQ